MGTSNGLFGGRDCCCESNHFLIFFILLICVFCHCDAVNECEDEFLIFLLLLVIVFCGCGQKSCRSSCC